MELLSLLRPLASFGWDDPYVTRTHEGLLKWKYPEMNSVDFLFEVMRSITDNITEEKLLEEIDEISLLPMYADRMQQAHTKMAQQQRRRLPPQC
ncbi:mRNA capping enzyme family protein [Zea mays]|uniref:mRNA capping enzyme family protein n=1 Tax=Zea mays TaxID=4577 RepID=A0A1D6PRX4_MAIZE|nr:mRNA capping enzyme family protein [Zea mays]